VGRGKVITTTKPKKVWRIIVTVTDQPEGDETYVTAEEIIRHIESTSLQAGLWLKVVDSKDLGTL
jgi:hypothetical protein